VQTFPFGVETIEEARFPRQTQKLPARRLGEDRGLDAVPDQRHPTLGAVHEHLRLHAKV
jgi:hypothetical protein